MRERTREFYREAVQRAAEQVAERLDHALDLGELASRAGLSPLHFHRIFRRTLGETPLALHRRLRLERAALELATTPTEVTVIAFDAGFETHESFTRAFQAAYALAPSTFRKRMARHREQMGRERRFPFELPAGNGIHIRPASGVTDIKPDAGEPAMEVIVSETPGIRLAAVSHFGPRNMVGEAFGRLAAVAGPAGLFAQPGAAGVAVFYPGEGPSAADQRTDAGVIVAEGVSVPDGLVEVRIPAGTYARTTHVGHYAHLSDTWAKLRSQWLPASGRRLAGDLTFEVYRVADHSQPDKLETDLFLPVV